MTHGNELDRHIGLRLQLARHRLQWSLERLADQIGVSVAEVAAYEEGVLRIGAARLLKISKCVGVDIGFFFEAGPSADMRSRRDVGPMMSGSAAGVSAGEDVDGS